MPRSPEPPRRGWTSSATAAELDLLLEETLDLFATLDLVHHDADTGAIFVAYPFSARPRGHSVLIDSTHRVEATCAIDD